MGPSPAHIRSLEIARRCAELGARQPTIAWVTGLPRRFILHVVFDPAHRVPMGRPPYSELNYFQGTRLEQAESSAFACKYRLAVESGFLPAEALVAAYAHYLTLTATPAVCFDKAFYIASELDGIWACRTPVLQLSDCKTCGARHLATPGPADPGSCPFCKPAVSMSMAECNQVGQQEARASSETDRKKLVSGLALRVEAMRLERSLDDVGAHPRVIRALMAPILAAIGSPLAHPPKALVTIRQPLSLWRWSEAVCTLERAQYGTMAIHYRRLLRFGFSPEQSLIGAYRHLRAIVPEDRVTFNRCFEVISLLDGRWGAPQPEFDLVPCGDCRGEHLVSRRDRRKAWCPFCALVRDPGRYVGRQAGGAVDPGSPVEGPVSGG